VAVNSCSLQAQRESVGGAAQLGGVAFVHVKAVRADGLARSPRLRFAVRRQANVEPARKAKTKFRQDKTLVRASIYVCL